MEGNLAHLALTAGQATTVKVQIYQSRLLNALQVITVYKKPQNTQLTLQLPDITALQDPLNNLSVVEEHIIVYLNKDHAYLAKLVITALLWR